MTYMVWIPAGVLGPDHRGCVATLNGRVLVGTEDEVRKFFPNWEATPFEAISLAEAYPDVFPGVMSRAEQIDQERAGLPRAPAPGLLEAEVGPDQQRRPDSCRSEQDGSQGRGDQA